MTEPTLAELCGAFLIVPAHEAIDGRAMPEPYRSLLVHTDHMTVTVERHYGEAVDVEVLASRLMGNIYQREILLRTHDGRKAVQMGIVQIALDTLPENVRKQILAQDTPLGRVLIANNVLTRVEPTEYLRIQASSTFARWFGYPLESPLYGRRGVIFAEGRPAIAMLEILAPIALSG